MIGKKEPAYNTNIDSFKHLYEKQMEFQRLIEEIRTLPVDNPTMFQYHISCMVEEIGEVLKADKRWKTHRNSAFDPLNKAEELADIFIVWVNMCIYSDIDYKEIYQIIEEKMDKNFARLLKEY